MVHSNKHCTLDENTSTHTHTRSEMMSSRDLSMITTQNKTKQIDNINCQQIDQKNEAMTRQVL